MLRRVIPALLLAALLPGCAWFGGGGEEQAGGPHYSVTVKNGGSHDVDVKLEVLDGSRLEHEDSFVVAAGTEEERDIAYHVNGTKLVRVTYHVDAAGRAASGTQENSFDPSTCEGTYRLTFEVRADEQLTLVGNHGECDLRG